MNQLDWLPQSTRQFVTLFAPNAAAATAVMYVQNRDLLWSLALGLLFGAILATLVVYADDAIPEKAKVITGILMTAVFAGLSVLLYL